MPYTENLNNHDLKIQELGYSVRANYPKIKEEDRWKLEKAEIDDSGFVLHDYSITRIDHTDDEPCKSPYCGVCYDYFIDDFLEQKEISKLHGLKKKLTQRSNKFLEDKYGFDACRIFKNRYSSLRYHIKTYKTKKQKNEESKEHVKKLIEKHGGITSFYKEQYL